MAATSTPVQRRLVTFTGPVIACGLAVIAAAVWELPSTPNPLGWAVLAVLALVAANFGIKIPGVSAWLSISDTFFMASVLLFGPAPATVTIALDSLIMSWRRGHRLHQLLFNPTGSAIALAAGAAVYGLVARLAPFRSSDGSVEAITLVPLACMAAVYFLLNSGLTVIAVALDNKTSPFRLWREHFAIIALNYFAAASAAFFLIVLMRNAGTAAVAAVVPLICICYLAMRSWLGRVDDAQRHLDKVNQMYLSTIGAFSTAIEAKDGVTSDHVHRVQASALGLARALGLADPKTVQALEAAALLHDTGKLAVPEHILNKPGRLTPAEFATMQLHVDVGADILSSIDFPYPVVPIVRAHHENWDGTGYPNGLTGTDIPIGARILSVVDCYDALTSDRPYRVAMSDDEALAIIRARRGSFYDPAIVDTFERVCRDIGPMPVKPQMQKAIQQISRAAALPQRPVLVPMPAPAPMTEGPDALRALANLARIVSGKPGATDVASMIWSHVRHVVPNASCAFFLNEPASDSVKVKFVAGDASSALQGLEMKLGDRLTGWVAENQQAIVNSEAKLDLGPEAAFVGLNYCVSLPLVSDGQLAGVLSLYAADPFRDEQIHTLQSVLPHLALMFLSLETRADSGIGIAPARQPLRVVSSR